MLLQPLAEGFLTMFTEATAEPGGASGCAAPIVYMQAVDGGKASSFNLVL